MKRMIIIVAICALLPAGGCGSHGVPVARVVTSFPDDGTQSYETVYEDGKVKKTDKFTPEADTIYQADFTDFSGIIEDNKIAVTLVDTKLTDEDGNEIEPDENIIKFMQWIADNAEHNIYEADFIPLQEKYFALVKLDVNWWDPCVLYMYDTEEQKFSELYKWDHVNIEGISLPD